MKNLIVVSILFIVFTLVTGCSNKDVPDVSATPDNNTNHSDTKTSFDPVKYNMIAVDKLSDQILSLTDDFSDNNSIPKQVTSVEIRSYLNGLSSEDLKYGILMKYQRRGSWCFDNKLILLQFCIKHDVDLFDPHYNEYYYPNILYAYTHIYWVNKSSDSIYAKDEISNKVYMNGFGETTEDQLPKNVLNITESETEHFIIDEIKYTAKELEEYLNKIVPDELKGGFLLTVNDVMKEEEVCFYTLWKFCRDKRVDLYVNKSYVKPDSPKFGKIQIVFRFKPKPENNEIHN